MSTLKISMIGPSLQQNGGIATVENLILKHASPGLQIQHITSFDDGSAIYKLRIFIYCLIKLWWRLLFQRTDLVYIHMSDGGSTLRKATIAFTAQLFRKPVVIHTHGPEFDSKLAKFPEWLQQWMIGVFRRCHGFIVLSKAWQEYYIQKLGLNEQQVFIVPNPTELPEQIPERTNVSKVKLVMCGRVGERKGTFDLIQAFAKLPDELKNRSELIIAGDGEVERGKQLVESLNLTSKITFPGWINSEQRNQLLATADVFVLPSYNEALPMAILEAMAWGLPIISTPVGGIPELVISKQNGLLVTPGDIQNLSTAIQSLIENGTLRLSLGREARASVARYDVKNYCIQLEKMFHSVQKSI